MNKQEFLNRLCRGLHGLPQDDIEERVTFYSEMIDDRIEEGFSEEEAISSVGAVDAIISQILAETPSVNFKKDKPARKPRKLWEIILLTLGSPLWLSLLITAFAAVISLYVSLWSIIVTLWAVFVSFVACALGSMVGGTILAIATHSLPGVALAGAGLIVAGLSVFLFYGCKVATKGTVLLTKKVGLWSVSCFRKKEELQ